MPLYEVEVSQKIVIEADDEYMAYGAAQDSISELDWQTYDIDSPIEITSLADLTNGWDGECIPYGGDGNTRLKDLLPNKVR